MTYESTFPYDTLSPICIFGTDIQSSSTKGNLGFTWNAFKWSTTVADSFTEQQLVECTIKLTKEEPSLNTKSCDGK